MLLSSPKARLITFFKTHLIKFLSQPLTHDRSFISANSQLETVQSWSPDNGKVSFIQCIQCHMDRPNPTKYNMATNYPRAK